MGINSKIKPGDYVSIRDPKPVGEDNWMPTIRDYSCGKIIKVMHKYIIAELPNGVRQKIPTGRCTVISEKEYFKIHLAGKLYH